LPFKKYCFCFSEDSQDGYHVSGMESIHNLHCAFNSSGVEANEDDREAWGESSMDLSLVDLCDDVMSGNIVRQFVLVCFRILSANVIKGFIHVYSRSAKRFEVNLVSSKNILLDGKTWWAKSSP